MNGIDCTAILTKLQWADCVPIVLNGKCSAGVVKKMMTHFLLGLKKHSENFFRKRYTIEAKQNIALLTNQKFGLLWRSNWLKESIKMTSHHRSLWQPLILFASSESKTGKLKTTWSECLSWLKISSKSLQVPIEGKRIEKGLHKMHALCLTGKAFCCIRRP